MTSEKFLSDIENIQKAIESKKLVVFVGAGVSMNSGLPSWNELVKQLKYGIGIDDNDTTDPLQVAQIYYNQKGHKEYIEKVRNLLFHKRGVYNELHDVIFDLNPEHVITTNYDNFLEQVIRKRALPFSIIKEDKDFPYSKNSNLLVKIHGDLDNDNFVLKEDDYLSYQDEHPLFDAFIKSIFSTKVVLFIGYGYSDPNLKIILHKVRNILGKDYQNSFLLTHSHFSEYKHEYLKNKGITVISFEDNQDAIDSYIKGANFKKNIYIDDNISLKIPGLYLYKLVKFIKYYDREEEKLNRKEVLDQMYLSLLKYNELRSLPYFFIASIFPFNNVKKQVGYNIHSQYSLKIRNSFIVDFFNDNTHNEHGFTSFTETYIGLLSNYEASSKKDKLNYIIEKLNSSGIYQLDLSHDARNRSKEHKPVELFTGIDKECDCLKCLYEKLKFNTLFINLTAHHITDTSNIVNDLTLAYTNYKVGNIYASCLLYEELALKAWESSNYIIYYIAKYSFKTLTHFIEYKEYKNIPKDTIKLIQEKGERINLEQIMNQLRFLPEEHLELIKYIRDGKVLQYCKYSIDELYEKIVVTYDKLNRGIIYYSGPDYFNQILFHLTSLTNFYSINCIVYDAFGNYKDCVNKALKGLLICYKFSNNYPYNNTQLNYGFCHNFVHYATLEDYKEFFITYSIEEIKLDEDSVSYLLDLINNYATSLFNENIYSSRLDKNNLVHSHIAKKVFNDNYLKIVENLLFLLSLTNIEQERIKITLKNLLKLIETSEFFYWKHFTYFYAILIKYEMIIDGNYFEKLFDVFTQKDEATLGDFVMEISKIYYNKQSIYRLSNKLHFERMMHIVHDGNTNNVYIHGDYIINLWKIVCDEYRDVVRGKIIDKLSSDFDENIYVKSSHLNIINYKMFFKEYLSYVQKMNNSYEKYEKHNGFSYSEFFTLIIMMYKLEIVLDESDIDILGELEDFMKFYINPSLFDVNSINIEWLNLTNHSTIHKHLSRFSYISQTIKNYIRKNESKLDYKNLYVTYYL
ncbi:SIR2 family protein [Tellurirhabdus rosea]|uniref:SIR2 family protein n=1 Tax=Tellurirhabdus rosea TaxID=2674997 RepID=UPI0022517121|nr:SIR2 family protein [Tellurirhabdus rosea]